MTLLLLLIEFVISERRNALMERWKKLMGTKFTLKGGTAGR